MTASPEKSVRRVALLVESSRSLGRGIVRGVGQWVREHRDWEIFYQLCGLGDLLPPWFEKWQGHGVIARLENRAMIDAVLKKGIPVVDVRGFLANHGVPVVRTDDRMVAQMAIEHFLERGFRHFAFCGYPGVGYSDRRCQDFIQSIDDLGYPSHIYVPRDEDRTTEVVQYEQNGLVYEEDLIPWLRSLPKPVALMASNDVRGHQVLNACRQSGIAVPETVAVLGVDNDVLLCELSRPPLSSIGQNTRQISRRAAEILADMMNAGEPPAGEELIEPEQVHTRQSTDVLAIDDGDIAEALRFIRQHAVEGIDVGDVLQKVPISRRGLERRFRNLLGRSPKQEIQRVRIQHIRALLMETDLPIHVVARAAGFEYSEHMITAFRNATGMTPGQFRVKHGKGGGEWGDG